MCGDRNALICATRKSRIRSIAWDFDDLERTESQKLYVRIACRSQTQTQTQTYLDCEFLQQWSQLFCRLVVL